MPPGKGRMAPSTPRIPPAAPSPPPTAPSPRPPRAGARLRRPERRRRVVGEDDDVAAADALHDPEALLDEELALHHRDAPVPPTAEHLAPLPAVAEVPQETPDGHLVAAAQAVEARGGRAGEHGLADALDEP